jgi:hypothetical protein
VNSDRKDSLGVSAAERSGENKARVTHDDLWGQAALSWLSIAAVFVIYGLVVISADRVSNRDLLLAVTLAGAGGAALSAAAEVVSHLGRRRFRSTWTPYYVIRPVLGAGLALMIYVIARGSLLSSNAPPQFLNFYGILALSVLAGLFARSALQKILETYDVVFTAGKGLYDSVEQKEPGAPPALEPYEGFVAYELSPAGEREPLRLTLWMQTEILSLPTGSQYKELKVGDGVPTRRTEFRFTVFSHNFRSVTPQSFKIKVEPFASETESRTFSFESAESESGADKTLTALIEISQYGQTVGVLVLGEEQD